MSVPGYELRGIGGLEQERYSSSEGGEPPPRSNAAKRGGGKESLNRLCPVSFLFFSDLHGPCWHLTRLSTAWLVRVTPFGAHLSILAISSRGRRETCWRTEGRLHHSALITELFAAFTPQTLVGGLWTLDCGHGGKASKHDGEVHDARFPLLLCKSLLETAVDHLLLSIAPHCIST